MRIGMSGAQQMDATAPDMRMLDPQRLARKVKRQDSGDSRTGSLQPHPMRSFYWACKLAFAPFLKKLAEVFEPVLMRRTSDALMHGRVEQPFCGRDRNGNKDTNMSLTVGGRYHGTTVTDAETVHWYRLSFVMSDKNGEIDESRGSQYIGLSDSWPSMQRQLTDKTLMYLRHVVRHLILPEHRNYREPLGDRSGPSAEGDMEF